MLQSCNMPVYPVLWVGNGIVDLGENKMLKNNVICITISQKTTGGISMKMLLKSSIVMLICLIVLCGCSNKKDLVGVYMAKNVSTPNDAIILYEDGNCSYFGDKDTKWETKDDTVTITKREPDEYYIDVYLDNALSSAEKRSIGTKCNVIENVYSSTFISEESKIRVEIISEKDSEQTQEALLDISGVTRTEFVVLSGDVHNYKFDIIDNCLVSSGGSVYIKQGN